MFITNENQDKLAERISTLMQCSSQLDMLVGFFYFSGLKVVAEPLRANKNLKLRVLVGMEAEQACGQLVELARAYEEESHDDIRNRFYASLRRILGNECIDRESFHERLGIFVELLEEGRLEMRKTKEPNHAKLYIFSMNEQFRPVRGNVWITGSSNFSMPGLNTRNELNVEISDFGIDKVSAYYEALWDEAIPLTADEDQRNTILEIVRDSSVAATVSPYEAYYLVLKNYIEYQRGHFRISAIEDLLDRAGFNRLQYQIDAVGQALCKLQAYHGVIIADVVGLGKSIIGSLVAAMSHKRGLIICPPGLTGEPGGATGGWHEYITKFGLHDWRVFSRGNLQKVEDYLARDPDFEMVIVDEAHYFRNEQTEAYSHIKNICANKDVVLLTATPFNNRPSDLLALLHLFSSGKQSPFVPGGNLDGRFARFQEDFKDICRIKKAITKNNWDEAFDIIKDYTTGELIPMSAPIDEVIRQKLKEIARALSQNIRQVMEKIVIRRNRLDLRSDPDYRNEISNLSQVAPPVEQFFELTPEQNEFYDRVVWEYFGPDGQFHGAFYRPQAYIINQAGIDDYQENIFSMLRHTLVLRFESSFGAFKKSVENAKKMMEMGLDLAERLEVFIYDRKITGKVMDMEDDVDAYALLLQLLEESNRLREERGRHNSHETEYRIKDKNFDGERFLRDLRSDIALMDKVLTEVEELHLVENDPKAQSLAKGIIAIVKGEHGRIDAGPVKRKVLVFTAFSDTLNHIAPYVQQAYPGRVLTVDSSTYTKDKRRLVKANFDASAEEHADDYDILLTTDKLSEGFNLNRAGAVVNYDIPWNPTRVIQRVGRINRIGQKVFDVLYILNYFPTLLGSTITPNREMAEMKMFAIHTILGEDAQIFSDEEEPTPAALFSKINASLDDEETLNTYTEIKLMYLQAKEFLEREHPEVLDRIKRFPNMVKTAMLAEPHSTLMFRRRGPGFFALQHTGSRDVTEIPIAEAIKQIACKFDTPRVPLTADFWEYAAERKKENKSPYPIGIYSDLKNYQPETKAPQRGGVSDNAQAVNKIEKFKPEFDYELKQFANEVIDDIQHYGALSRRDIKKLAAAQTAEAAATLLIHIRNVRGYDYVQNLRDRALGEEIVITVQKN